MSAFLENALTAVKDKRRVMHVSEGRAKKLIESGEDQKEGYRLQVNRLLSDEVVVITDADGEVRSVIDCRPEPQEKL